ncbi:hypothetical protein O9G_005137 [Rozella allomycis CSF55]|uniref:Uncharacterized protein n=1 Tax=Rozella allomycis (strain CSF55) TaxID=988480 RepID=A0A075B3K4_ROZAC|nr:hypothetical protein O9G_005137 [Rozella allomycis CSF55]|eukprot:EPZ35571.1 hypothetical protein O9G_005137 [Rozella allomycis CSF55]
MTLDLQEYAGNNEQLRQILRAVSVDTDFVEALRNFRTVTYVDGVVKRDSDVAKKIVKIANDADSLMDDYCSTVVSRLSESLDRCNSKLRSIIDVLGCMLNNLNDEKELQKYTRALQKRIQGVTQLYSDFEDHDKTVRIFTGKFENAAESMNSLKREVDQLCLQERSDLMNNFKRLFTEITLNGKKQSINNHYEECNDRGVRALLLTLAIYVSKKQMDGENDFALDFDPKDDYVLVNNNGEADCVPYYDLSKALQCVDGKIPEVDIFLKNISNVNSEIRVHKTAIKKLSTKFNTLICGSKDAIENSIDITDFEIKDLVFEAACARYHGELFLKALQHFHMC